MGVNIQQWLDAEVDREKAEAVAAALAADAIEDAKVIQAKDDEIARLNARIAELEAGNPEPEPEPEEPSPSTVPTAAAFKALKSDAERKAYLASAKAWFVANTGVPKGIALKRYTGPWTITEDGTVLDGYSFDRTLLVRAANVAIKRSSIAIKNGYWGIDAEGGPNLTVTDTTIIGPGQNGDANAGILGGGTFLRNNISQFENGIVLQGGKSVVQSNYVHDLNNGKDDPHYDGIAAQGGQKNVLIEGNLVEGRDTSDVFIKDDWSAIDDVRVIANFLFGNPGYTVYSDARGKGLKGSGKSKGITNVQFKDNVMQRGYYGFFSIDLNTPVISGNVDLDGKPAN